MDILHYLQFYFEIYLIDAHLIVDSKISPVSVHCTAHGNLPVSNATVVPGRRPSPARSGRIDPRGAVVIGIDRCTKGETGSWCAVHKLESDPCSVGIKPDLDVGTQGISNDYTGSCSGAGIGNGLRISDNLSGVDAGTEAGRLDDGQDGGGGGNGKITRNAPTTGIR